MGKIVTTKAYLSTLGLLHKAISFSMLLFAGSIYYVKTLDEDREEILSINFWIFLILVMGFVWLIQFFYIKRVNKLKEKEKLSSKLKDYMTTNVICWALTEFSISLSFIFYFLTQQMNFFFLGIFLWVILFAIQAPSYNKIINHLGLRGEERQKMEDPEFDLYEAGQR